MTENNKKRCPLCFEEIHVQAIKCKHCGSILNDKPSSTPSLSGIHLVNHALGDRYEVLEEIGSGGMATVYKAIQHSLGRTVALKVIHQNLVHDEAFVKRFNREAKISASLQHPNIVTIHDVGEAQGVHYMAMEYLEGTDLHRLIGSRGKCAPEQTLQYLLPVAEALDYAHGRGYIHRDIKSANIFITGSGRIVLMDFGIAHAAAGTQLTRAGTVIGTPEYMSPEQAEGKKVDHRTDLYSLGVVIYECLAGKVPFTSESAISTIHKVIYEEPDSNALQNAPATLAAFALDLLSKNPENRPETAIMTAQTIRQLLSGKEVDFVHYHGGSQKTQTHFYKEKTPAEINAGTINIADAHKKPLWVSSENEKDRHLHLGNEGQSPPNHIHLKSDPFEDLMVLVKGGTFVIGATKEQKPDALDAESLVHAVTLDDYYMCKYPVTQKQWLRIMGYNPSFFKGCDDCPVENVSWEHVQDFINTLNTATGKRYSLPTEAQWEFAARGGNMSKGFIYSGSDDCAQSAWYKKNSNDKTQPIGQKRPNELGIYDMSGNVWEWCIDWYSKNYKHNYNPMRPSSGFGKVLRGGCFCYSDNYCTVSARYSCSPNKSYFSTGFRLVSNYY